MSVGNTKYGDGALQKNINGSNNSAFGICSSRDTDVSWNTSVGAYSNMSNVSGISNVAVGTNSLLLDVSGSYNTALGTATLLNNKVNSNTAVGSNSMEKNTTGKENVALGVQTGYENVTGEKNVFLGSYAGFNNIDGSENIFLGYNSGFNVTNNSSNSSKNSFLGANTGVANNNEQYVNSTAVGYGSIIDASNVIVVGTSTETTKIPGKLNVLLDTSFNLRVDVSGTLIVKNSDIYVQNVRVGRGNNNIFSNTVVGKDAGLKITNNGFENVFIGYESGSEDLSGSYNTFVGYYSGRNNTTGISNDFIGKASGASNTTGQENTFLGSSSGYNNSTGSNNVYLGNSSGFNSKGNNNVLIGDNTDASGNIYNSIAIGSGVKVNTDNTIIIGTSSQTTQIPGTLHMTNIDGELRRIFSSKYDFYDLSGSSLNNVGTIYNKDGTMYLYNTKLNGNMNFVLTNVDGSQNNIFQLFNDRINLNNAVYQEKLSPLKNYIQQSIITADVSTNPNNLKYTNISYYVDPSSSGTPNPALIIKDSNSGNSLYFIPNSGLSSWSPLSSTNSQTIIGMGPNQNNASLVLSSYSSLKNGIKIISNSSSHAQTELWAGDNTSIILNNNTGVSMNGKLNITSDTSFNSRVDISGTLVARNDISSNNISMSTGYLSNVVDNSYSLVNKFYVDSLLLNSPNISLQPQPTTPYFTIDYGLTLDTNNNLSVNKSLDKMTYLGADTNTSETIWLDSGNKDIKVNGIRIGSGIGLGISSNILIGNPSENDILGTNNISIGNQNIFNNILDNSIAIGNNVSVTENNTIILGNNNHVTQIPGKLLIEGDVSMNSKLKVTGDASFNLNVDVLGNLTLRNRAYQQLNSDSSWNSVNGYYGLAKDAYPALNPYSTGVQSVSTWTIRSASSSQNFMSVCWSPILKLFAAVSYDGTTNRVITSFNGFDWTLRITPNLTCSSICWSDKKGFVAVGTGVVMTSTNGTTWTQCTPVPSNSWISVCWSDELGIFVAVGASASSMTSEDGITWQTYPMVNDSWLSICWSAELRLFVAVSINKIITSNDGQNWILSSNSVGSINICWSAELGLFVGVNDNLYIIISSDGVTWSQITNPISNRAWYSVCWSAELGLFACIAYNYLSVSMQNVVMTSPDGINWTIRQTPAINTTFNQICWSPELGIFVAVGKNTSNNSILISSLKGRPPTCYNVFDSCFNEIDQNGNWNLKVKTIGNTVNSDLAINSIITVNNNINQTGTTSSTNRITQSIVLLDTSSANRNIFKHSTFDYNNNGTAISSPCIVCRETSSTNNAINFIPKTLGINPIVVTNDCVISSSNTSNNSNITLTSGHSSIKAGVRISSISTTQTTVELSAGDNKIFIDSSLGMTFTTSGTTNEQKYNSLTHKFSKQDGTSGCSVYIDGSLYFTNGTTQSTAYTNTNNNKLNALGTTISGTMAANFTLTSGTYYYPTNIVLSSIGTYIITVNACVSVTGGTTTVGQMMAGYSSDFDRFSQNVNLAILNGGSVTYNIGDQWSLNSSNIIVNSFTNQTYFLGIRCTFGTTSRMQYVQANSSFTTIRIA